MRYGVWIIISFINNIEDFTVEQTRTELCSAIRDCTNDVCCLSDSIVYIIYACLVKYINLSIILNAIRSFVL